MNNSTKRGFMPDTDPKVENSIPQQQWALSTWDTEGGAGPGGPQEESDANESPRQVPALTNTEVVQLRVRVIALENLVIALLAGAPDRQLTRARSMAAHISPRPGSTPHPMTLRAATQMINLVDRASSFRGAEIVSR
jgi:hypothetical protein